VEQHATLTVALAREVGQRLQGNVAQGAKRPLIHPNGHVKRRAASGADGVGQIGDTGGGNTRERGSACDGVHCSEIEESL
jgi:hypothetical protein